MYKGKEAIDWSDKAKRKAARYWAFKLSRDNDSLSKSQQTTKAGYY